MNYYLILLSFLMSVTACSKDNGETPFQPEDYDTVPVAVINNFEVNESSSVYSTEFSSSLISVNGEIYLSYITPDLYAAVAKLDGTDTLQITKIFPDVHADGHHKASLGIDSEGYIHYAADMHSHTSVRPANEPSNDRENAVYFWQYWVSDKPYDISSFTFYGDDPERRPPGEYVTYQHFYRDRKDNLYAAFRHRVSDQYAPGTFAGGIAKYNPETKSWQMLGGTDYIHGEKTLIWNNSGRVDHAYQTFKIGVHFDRLNTMHVTWTVYTEESGQQKGGYDATHLMYAYSPDEGKTWYKANDEAISALPLTINRGDVVTKFVPGDLRGGSYVVCGPDEKPVITTSRKLLPDGKILNLITRHDGNEWAALEPLQSDGTNIQEEIVSDKNGYIFAFLEGRRDKLLRSRDGGITWDLVYTVHGNGKKYEPDDFYTLNTGNFRFSINDLGDRVVRTVIFD